MLAAARPRRASASRAPSAAKPPPRRSRRALGDLGAAQQRDRRARGRAPRGPRRGAGRRPPRSRASAPASGASSAQPGGCSLSASSRSPAAPRTASAPIAMPSDAGQRRPSAPRATRARRRSARARSRSRAARRWPAGGAGRRPPWWPRASSPPRPSAMSEKAMSSAMTIPAAESMSTRTPLRVTKRTPRTWVLVARACCRSTSTRSGSAAQISAWSTAEALPGLALEPRARDVHPRRRGEREGDVVGRHRDPHHAQRRPAARPDVVADADVPGVGHAALDDDLVRAPVDVAPGDDRVAAPAGVDERDAALLRRAVRRRPRRRR